VFVFSWELVSKAVDDQLVKLTGCRDKWKEYKKHRTEVANQVADIEELVRSLSAAAANDRIEHLQDVDKICVCIMSCS